MLKKPSTQVLSALASLEGNTNFETVRSWLDESLQDLRTTSCYTKDEVITRWQQGAAQAVEDLLGRSKEASAILRKSR